MTVGGRSLSTKSSNTYLELDPSWTLRKQPAQGWREGKWLVVAGKTKVDTVTHGLPTLGQLVTAVNKLVYVEFRLVFDLPPELQIAATPAPASKPAEPPAPAAPPRAGG